MLLRQCIFLFIVLAVAETQSARILGVFTVPSVSHQIVFQPIWRELSLRGHTVTVLTPNPLKDPSLTNLTEIDLSFQYRGMEQHKQHLAIGLDHWTMLNQVTKILITFSEEMLEDDEVSKFVQDSTTSYDVVLAEVIDATNYAFAAKFKCPLIGIASLTAPDPTHEAIGNPGHPILYPNLITPYYGGNEMGFIEKLDTVLFELYYRYLFHFVLMPSIDNLVRKHFGNNMPSVKDIERNMSLLLLNTNPIFHKPRPYGPNVIEFGGGIHLKPKKSLPADLKSFLDNSPEGVIYFSLGSNVKSIYLPEQKRKILIETFAELPYKVLWKFEDERLEGQPENVRINQWLPQQDVLSHPNIKLFITQGGLQSVEEAVLNGIPLLAIPFLGDQFVNSMRIEKLGIGRRLNFDDLSKENLLTSILEIIQNPKYKETVEKVGRLVMDQPMTGLEKAIWWIEYVIRNKGAPYLQNPRAGVSWAEFLILDVVAFLFGIFIVSVFLLYKVTQLLSTLVTSQQKKSKLL